MKREQGLEISMWQSKWCRAVVLSMLIFACLIPVVFRLKDDVLTQAVATKQPIIDVIANKQTHLVHGPVVSGKSFNGKPFRSFKQNIFRSRRRVLLDASAIFANIPPPHLDCRKWAVITTIFPPGLAIERLLESDKVRDGWCVVVVADTKTPPRKTYPPAIVYISVEEQLKLKAYLRVVRLLPMGNYARKNIGYLYAIAQDAEVILDADDDNAVFADSPIPVRHPANTSSSVTQSGSVLGTKVFNPYPYFGGTTNGSWWPRGFPINAVSDPRSRPTWHPYFKHASDEAFVVQQSLANIDPDVDAIFRMTRPGRTIIWDSDKWPVYPPAGVLSPYNSQATIYLPEGFWSLVLPATVHGRVSDIWRSYWAQRLMWDVGQRVLFVPAFVEHNRTAHNFFSDYNAEEQIYEQAHALVELLGSWDGSTIDSEYDDLPNRARSLAIWMYERGFWESNDIWLLDAWFHDLETLGYNFTKVLPNADHFVDGLRKSVRKHGDNQGCIVILVDESNMQELVSMGIFSGGIANAPFIGSPEVPLFFFIQAEARGQFEHLLKTQLTRIEKPLNYEIFEIDGYHFHAPPMPISSRAQNLKLRGGFGNFSQSAGYTWCSQFLALDMYMHPRLREFRYLWRLDQDVSFRSCETIPAVHQGKCTRLLNEGPFQSMIRHGWKALDLQTGPFSREAGFVISQLKERAIAWAQKFSDGLNSPDGAGAVSKWNRHLLAGFSETIDQWYLFQNPQYYDYLDNIDAMSSGIWHLFWREQAIKTVWILLAADEPAIGDRWEAFFPTLTHKGLNNSYFQ